MSDFLGALDNIVVTLNHMELDVNQLKNAVIKLRLAAQREKQRRSACPPLEGEALHPDLQDLYFEHDHPEFEN